MIKQDLTYLGASRVTQVVKNLPAMQETSVQLLGQEIPLVEETGHPLQYSWASLVAQMVKNPPAMQETWVQTLCWEDSPRGGHGIPP